MKLFLGCLLILAAIGLETYFLMDLKVAFGVMVVIGLMLAGIALICKGLDA